ncbi:MAG: energy-coupling factor ABC transporter permease [Lachnospiraceae bacterium]|nr:energy-coupling factor ABC transporter permease [Lachnospiraceae bacterium]
MKNQKNLMRFAVMFAALFSIAPVANAMHIMEGYLPLTFCIGWGVLCLPFLVAGYFSLRKTVRETPKTKNIIAISAAFIFVISSLKIASLTGSCSHMTGTGLGAILLGPSAVGVLGLIVLVFQALLLAHGGLTTLGANTFSMAIAGPFLSYGIYFVCKKLKINRKIAIFLAASLGDLFTYCITSFQLAMAYPSNPGGIGASITKFLGVFAPTQLPLAVVEGLITVLIISALETYAIPELKMLGFITKEEQ